MSTPNAANRLREPAAEAGATISSLRPPRLPRARRRLDRATLLGLTGALSLVAGAIALTGSLAAFASMPAALIVLGGTATVTAVSFTGRDLGEALSGFRRAVAGASYDQRLLARQLIQVADFARSAGRLRLDEAAEGLPPHGLLRQSLHLVADGLGEHAIKDALRDQAQAQEHNEHRAAAVLRRASEIAPGMGLIGTLVGLVQMLSQLDDPASIGPAMAVALLTTFYGAVLGTVILGPLASKLERRAEAQALSHRLIVIAAAAMARQESPRRLETLLNGVLPPEKRVALYD